MDIIEKDGRRYIIDINCRFGGGYECYPIATAAAKYCDVISVNVYRESLDGYHLDTQIDAPLLIGEFSFWGLDRGIDELIKGFTILRNSVYSNV